MVNEEVNTGQRAVAVSGDDSPMDSSWTRVQRLLNQRKLKRQWLVDQLGYTKQRVAMWAKRGNIPADEHAAVAAVLGKSTDWLNGMETSDSPEPDLSAMARTLAREFDTIKDPQRALTAFAQCIAAIERGRAT